MSYMYLIYTLDAWHLSGCCHKSLSLTCHLFMSHKRVIDLSVIVLRKLSLTCQYLLSHKLVVDMSVFVLTQIVMGSIFAVTQTGH